MLMKKKSIILLLVTTLFFLLSGCSGGGSSSSMDDNGSGSTDNNTTKTTNSSMSGLAQKGPFVQGSVVTAYKLSNGSRGSEFQSTTTSDDRGHFTISLPWSGPTEFEIVGSYLDETTGNIISDGALSAIVNVTAGETLSNININIFTQIAAARIKKLLKTNHTIEEAKQDSNNKIKEMFNLDLPGGISPENLDLTDGMSSNKSDNLQLLKVSSALLKTDNPSLVLENIVEYVQDNNESTEGAGDYEALKEEADSIDVVQVTSVLSEKLSLPLEELPLKSSRKGKLPLNHGLSFAPKVDVALNVEVDSDLLVITGLEGEATLSINNGFYTLNGEAFSNENQTIKNGDTIRIRQVTSSVYSTSKTSTLYIGGAPIPFQTITMSNIIITNDTTPNKFNFTTQVGKAKNSLVESNSITISGLSIGKTTDIQVSNGEYKINNGQFVSTKSTVANGDKVAVRVRANSQSNHSAIAKLTVGGVAADFVVYTASRDIKPDTFSPVAQYNVDINTIFETPYFTMSGYDGALDLNVTNGEVQLDGDTTWRTSIPQLPAGYRVKFRQTSSSEYDTQKDMTIKIGSLQEHFITVTKVNPRVADSIPDQLLFTPRTAQPLNTFVESEDKIITGLDELGVAISASSGVSYSKDGGITWKSSGRIIPGNKIRLQLKTGSDADTKYSASLYYGASHIKFATFNVYTMTPDVDPDPIHFNTVLDANLSTAYISDEVRVTGIGTGTSVQVLNAQYSKNGSAWTDAGNFTLNNGDRIRLKLTSSSLENRETKGLLVFPNKSYSFSVTTSKALLFFNTPLMVINQNAHYSYVPDVGNVQNIIFSIQNKPSWMNLDTNSGTLTGTPRQADVGIYKNIKLIATNSAGITSSRVFNISVNNVNDEPKITTSFSAQAANEDSVYTKVLTATDPDGDTLTWSIENNPAWLHINAQTGTLSGTPRQADVGTTQNIIVKVTDSNLSSNSLSFDMTVYNVNDNARMNAVSNQTATEGQLFSYRPGGFDQDGDTLLFSTDNKPSWLDFNTTTGEFKGTPTAADVGVYKNIGIGVTDQKGQTQMSFFQIIVIAVNDAPIISSSSFGHEFILDDNYKGAHNYGVSFTISDVDTNMADLNVTVTHAITESRVPAEGLSKAFNYSSVKCESDGKCTANISIEFTRPDGLHPSLKTRHIFTVSDGDKNATNYVDIWYAPTVPQLSGETEQLIGFTTRQETAYRHYSFTPVNAANKAQSWSIQNKPKWADFNTSTGELSGVPALDQNGTYNNIQITATNDRGSDTFTFNIVVKDKTPPKKFEITDYYGVDINKYYDTFLTVDWLADGETANISSSGYDGQASHSGFTVNGDNTITTVRNGDIVRVGHLSSNEYATELRTTITIGEDSDDFITRTKASESANLPLIVGAPQTNGNINENYSYTPQMSTDYTRFAPATKPFEIQNKPEWATFNPTTGELSGTPTEAGVYKDVKIIAYGDNGLDDITFDITIDNNGPYISGTDLSLDNDTLDLTFNDNSDWRSKVTEVALYSCGEQITPNILASDDYTFNEGTLTLHDSTSSNVALHTPSMNGGRLIVKSEGYQDSESYLDMIADGQYGIYATLSAPTPLTEANLDGAKVEIALENTLAFKDATLDASNFTFVNAPADLRIESVTYKDATHAELTLAYNGIDFDTDAQLSLSIAADELNTPCAVIETNTIDVVAIVEKPFINMLYPDDPSEDAYFGHAVADDNNTVAVGARTGLYIFKKGADGNYTQTQKIASSLGHAFFASSLAMDGDYLLVGDRDYSNEETDTTLCGNAAVYKKDANGDYQFLQDLTPTDNAAYDHFGTSLDISGDMIIIGADNADDHKGKAYLYKKDGSGHFALINTLTRANGKALDSFGYDVAITHGFQGTPDENNYFILVGSNVMPYFYEENGEWVTDTKEELGSGFANYYTYTNDTLSAPVVISADDSTDLADHFGDGVALDGNMVIIGSLPRLYVYSRGQGNALSLKTKIENAAGPSGQNLEVKWSGFDNHARYVVVAGHKSFITIGDGSWTFNAYQSNLENNDDLGYAASVSGFEVAYGSYSNSDLVSRGGAVLVTHAYENITSTTSSALTPPVLSTTIHSGLSVDDDVYSFEADDNWKNAITHILYKAGANAEYSVVSSSDYEITADNTIIIHIASSSNVNLHTPYQSAGSLLVKADGYLDDVLTINGMNTGYNAIKADINTATPLKEDTLDDSVINITLSNTLEFADATLESSNFTLVGAPNGTTLQTVTYVDATHANLTLAFDGTDFDQNTSLNVAINASELNAYEGVNTNSLNIEAINEVAGSGTALQAIDPYITNARFWYDKNGNGQVEDFELSSYSDENGSFSFTTTLDENGSVVMVESGLHNARAYDGNLTLIYNSNAPAIISPVTTLLAKSFTLDEIRTLLVDAGVDGGLTTDELLLDPFDSSLLPADANMSTFLSPELSKFRRVLMANAVLNAVLASTQSYGLDKESINAALTTIYSVGGPDGGADGGNTPDTSLLGYFVNIGNIVLSDGNLQSNNAKAQARTFVAISNYIAQIIKDYIVNNGAIDDFIVYELDNSVTQKLSNIIEALTYSYKKALDTGIVDPKIEWVKKQDENSYRPLWMLEVANLGIKGQHAIMMIYKDENGDAQKIEFDPDQDYLEDYEHFGTWSVSNGKVLANGKEFEFRGTKLRIDGIDYPIIDVGFMSNGSIQPGNFYAELPTFSTSVPEDGASYVDVNSSFVIKIHENVLEDVFKEHTTCSLAQGYNGNVDLNISFGRNYIVVTPKSALKHNAPYSLSCSISYGDDTSLKFINFSSEELYIPILATGQKVSYNADGIQTSTPCDVKDDGCYQLGYHVDHSDNGDTVLDIKTGLEWEDDGATDTNSAGRTKASYGPCEMLDLAGHTDWRAPTALEMMSLFDFQGTGVNGFENISTLSTGYWTSTIGFDSTAYNSDEYLYVVMPKYLANTDETYSKMHMCVRIIDDNATDEAEMKKEGDIVIDYKDSLEWSDDVSVDQDKRWIDAIGTCEASTLGGHDDWRLPNINELVRTAGHSMTPSDDVNQVGYLNSINTIFAATNFYEDFWSSTTDTSTPENAYILEGRYGSIKSVEKSVMKKVRCVRTR